MERMVKGMYKSPIEVITNDIFKEITTQFENGVMMEVTKTMEVKIDKQELTKALLYDRDQYNNGFNDAVALYHKTGHRIVDEDGDITCSVCGSKECWGNYCMHCGAEMSEMDEEV